MTNEMMALVKARPEPGLWLERQPVPEPGPDEVLIKVKKSKVLEMNWKLFNRGILISMSLTFMTLLKEQQKRMNT